MTKNYLFALTLVLCFGPACDPEVPLDAGVDAPGGDTNGEDGGRDASRDSGPVVPGLPVSRAAAATSTAAFCSCLPMRGAMMVTEAACLAANAPDPEVTACEDRATVLIGDAFDAFYHCRAAAFTALGTCYSGTCSDAAVTACNGDFQTANTACQGMLPAMATVQAYLADYQACIVERVTGEMGSCPDDASMVSSAVGPAVFSGSTALAGNDSEPFVSCFGGDAMSMMDAVGAPDRSYRWRAPAAGSYRLDTIGADFDTILYVRSACTDSIDVACQDDIVMGIDQDSCVVISAADAEEFVIIVDGFGDVARGNFAVNITADTACPGGVLPDAGMPMGDAGMPDGGMPDAGMIDAGMIDAP